MPCSRATQSLTACGAIRADSLERVKQALAQRDVIPVYVGPWGPLLATLQPRVLVDARMRKHSAPEVQRDFADFTIGLGPDLIPGRHADVVIETSWECLGAIVMAGAALPLAGEPRELAGHARDRYVYAPLEGVFHTKARIGDVVNSLPSREPPRAMCSSQEGVSWTTTTNTGGER